jgi:hypothetical protein
MHYDVETLAKYSKSAQFELDLSVLGPRMKNAIVTALKTGIITSTRGVASTIYTILADQAQLPIMAFSKRGVYWDKLWLKRVPAECLPQIRNWWKVDRITLRMNDPERWAQYSKTSWGDRVLVEPDWMSDDKDKIAARMTLETVDILSTKNLDLFHAISEHYTKTEEYQEKIQQLIPAIKAGSTVTIKQNWSI